MSALFPQLLLDTHEELIIDCFAGGGGASSGIEQAFGRQVDIAVNHDPAAVAMHAMNHPQTRHLVNDVFEVDPREVTQGRPVGFAWFSPDCTFHSKARGGKPFRSKERKRRSLAWVVTWWAATVKPRIIMLENVEEFQDWGPLVGPPDALRPCRRRRGRTFRQWVKSLTKLGYAVEWRELRACEYGAPTIRKRFYLIARCDGKPIVWPTASHGDPKLPAVQSGKLKPYRTAGECIDWSIPMPSIFLSREEAKEWGQIHHRPAPIRPLAENTHRRIARGIRRFVLENPKPFLVQLPAAIVSPVIGGVGGRAGQSPERSGDQPTGTVTGKADAAVVAPIISPVTHEGDRRTPSADEPLATITAAKRGEQALVAPYLVPRYSERDGQEPRVRSAEDPAPVVVPDGNGGSLAAVHLHTANNSRDPLYGADEPANTIVSDGARHSVMAAHISTYHTEREGEEARASDIESPSPTLDCSNRHGVVAAFLGQHNGGFAEGNSADGHDLTDPSSTISCKGPHQSLVAGFMSQGNSGFYTADGRKLDDPLGTILTESRGHHGVAAVNLIEQHGTAHAEDAEKPLQTIAASGNHHAVCASHIQRDFGQSVGSKTDQPIGTVTPDGGGKAGLVASFLAKYYGQGTGQATGEPIHTVPTVDRFGLVTVEINGQPYFISDICMRMLQPHELYAAQGFRPGYIIDRGADGRKLTKTEQVRMCGNSVSPPVAEALARANAPELIVRQTPRRAA